MLCDIKYLQAPALYKHSYQDCFGENDDPIRTLLEESDKACKSLGSFLARFYPEKSRKWNTSAQTCSNLNSIVAKVS